MISKSLSRVLNQSNVNNFGSSNQSEMFDEYNELEEINDSFTTFHFTEKKNINNYNDFVPEETDYLTEKLEESFLKRDDTSFEHFEKERKYVGIITGIDSLKHSFSAKLIESDDNIKRDVIFSIDDIPAEDIKYIEVGRRIIYIYGKQYRNGTATNESKVYFRKYGGYNAIQSIAMLDYDYGYVKLSKSIGDSEWSIETYGAVEKYDRDDN